MSECTCHKNYTLDTPDPTGRCDHRYSRGDSGCKNILCNSTGWRKAF